MAPERNHKKAHFFMGLGSQRLADVEVLSEVALPVDKPDRRLYIQQSTGLSHSESSRMSTAHLLPDSTLPLVLAGSRIEPWSPKQTDRPRAEMLEAVAGPTLWTSAKFGSSPPRPPIPPPRRVNEARVHVDERTWDEGLILS